jgi:hypothetical protein
MPADVNQDPPATDVEGKLRLETQKLQLEIIELQQWWRRPTYIQSVLAVVIALIAAGGALITAYVNGWFDAKNAVLQAQTARLETQKLLVESEIQNLNAGKTALNVQISGLTNERDRLKHEVETYKNTAEIARNNATELQRRLVMEGNVRKTAEDRVKVLQSSVDRLDNERAMLDGELSRLNIGKYYVIYSEADPDGYFLHLVPKTSSASPPPTK